MFGLFRKGPRSWFDSPVIPATLQTIPVRRSAFEASQDNGSILIEEVIHFVNKMNDDGKFHGDEIPTLAMQSYHADYYKAQVANGGHQQFVHNCGEQFSTITTDALAGLMAMGAEDHVELLEDMLALIADIDHDGPLDGIAEELALLDDEFSELEHTQSMEWKNVAWIRGWLILEVVDDANYDTIVRETARMNPKRDTRAEMREIGAIIKKMHDPVHAMISLALMRCESKEMIYEMQHGTFHEHEGNEVMAIHVKTLTGKKIAIMDGDTVSIHADENGQVGAFEARADKSDIEGFVENARTTNAAVALYYMLCDTGHAADSLMISPMSEGFIADKGVARWVLASKFGGSVMCAEFHENGAYLMKSLEDDDPLAMMRKAEIDKRFEALSSQL